MRISINASKTIIFRSENAEKPKKTKKKFPSKNFSFFSRGNDEIYVGAILHVYATEICFKVADNICNCVKKVFNQSSTIKSLV